jgi:hypothetical protein
MHRVDALRADVELAAHLLAKAAVDMSKPQDRHISAAFRFGTC